jgi:hypothetical protein
MSTRLEEYQDAAERAAAWLLNRQRADGSLSDVEDGVQPYHKIPYAWALSGHVEPANRLLDWVSTHAMTPDGDLKGKEGRAACGWYDKFYTYANSWIVLGAARLGRCELARDAVNYILKYCDAESGGVFSLAKPSHGQPHRQDIVSTSKAGSACLSTGYINEATLMGDWFIRLLESQPDPDAVLYTCWDPDSGLITSFPEEESLIYAVYVHGGLQWFYYPGIAMEFLTRLFQVTGQRKYLEASFRFFDFSDRCGADILRTDPGDIIGSAAASMYSINGDIRCRDAALVVGDSLVGKQSGDGSWFKHDEADAMDTSIHHQLRIEGTAEFVVWLAEIESALKQAEA